MFINDTLLIEFKALFQFMKFYDESIDSIIIDVVLS